MELYEKPVARELNENRSQSEPKEGLRKNYNSTSVDDFTEMRNSISNTPINNKLTH